MSAASSVRETPEGRELDGSVGGRTRKGVLLCDEWTKMGGFVLMEGWKGQGTQTSGQIRKVTKAPPDASSTFPSTSFSRKGR